MKTPASCYQPSPRAYPSRLPEPEYDQDFQVRRVRACGGFSWKGRKIFISEVLRNEPIGFELIEDDFWLVYFAAFPIALFDSHEFRILDLTSDLGANRGQN